MLSPVGCWLTVVGIVCLGILTTFSETPARSSVVLVVAAAVAYLLAFAVYMATASVAHDGKWPFLVIAAIAGVTATLLMGDWRWSASLTLAPVLIAAVAVGTVSRKHSDAAAFWTGTILLIGVMAARDWGTWIEQSTLLAKAAPLVARDVVARLSAFGLTGGTTEAIWAGRIGLLSWYLPGLLVCSALVPFSVGSLWLFARVARATGQPSGYSVLLWKMPRLWLLITLLGVLGHQLGGTTVQQLSDNALFGLAIAFAVVGTVALEYFFRARSVWVWLRAVVYIALVVTHVYGLVTLIAIGLIDTLFGWRRGKEARLAGKESVS